MRHEGLAVGRKGVGRLMGETLTGGLTPPPQELRLRRSRTRSPAGRPHCGDLPMRLVRPCCGVGCRLACMAFGSAFFTVLGDSRGGRRSDFGDCCPTRLSKVRSCRVA
ncbi:hypothetical protein [Streptomyces phaeochromogenes]|uniref:hypothetical protein n=1 Tax=Streptomyces phaeochromogenes TaxID=1923 RepID=UPI00386D2D4E